MKVLRKPQQKDIVMPAHAFAWRTHYAILFALKISQVFIHKNRHNVSLIFSRNVTTPTLRREWHRVQN